MARMIPGVGPRSFATESREGVVYEALKLLPDDYTVVHSMHLLRVSADQQQEREADFVIFNPHFGILCVEVKAGRVRYEGGEWLYGNGVPMRRGGPYNQASTVKYCLMDLMRDRGLSRLLQRCQMHHAVWFLSIDEADIGDVALPSEAEKKITLFREDLSNPEPKIRNIMSLDAATREVQLTDCEADLLLTRVLCPQFDLVPNKRLRYDLREQSFLRLLNSQKTILDFLVDQRSAVINGVAGSGKTLIAVERACRLNECGEKVLLLCYNALLQSDLKRRCAECENIDVYTIAGFACKETRSAEPDYVELNKKLEWYFDEEGSFPYKHVIVDEGQDFGLDAVEQADVLQSLSLLTEQNNGTFYLFYDKNQLIQGSGMPGFIEEADCRLSLYVNCRNTKNIALCSMAALSAGGKCITREDMISGVAPKLFVSSEIQEQISFVERSILELQDAGIDDIVILTCKTENRSALRECIVNQRWRDTEVRFYSCRKFKGLEADAIILVDVDEEVWSHDAGNPFDTSDGLMFYVGASRAKHELRIVCDMDEDQCEEVLEALNVTARRRPFRELARRLKAKPA